MNEQAIFLAALEIANLADRASFVKQACDGNPTLLRQVDALLAAHERSGEFLDVPALRQIAASASEDWPSLHETQTVNRDIKDKVDLSFLLPSTQPGSLGRLGHYEVEEVIGRGGCGIVLKAFDEILHRLVAIKVMTPEMAATSPARKRFLREARAAASIQHENVVRIHSVEEKPIPFLVMEYIAGQTLQQKLDQKGPLDVSEVVQIGQQIASGLEAAHAIGLIHRDIKPANILLDKSSDRIKLTDFGLARTTDDASITQSGVIAGTPLYMSPEQAQGSVIDHRSDLFSLGSVFYVMCSGRPPFRAPTTLAVLKRVAEDEPRPIREIMPEIPDWLIAIIAKLLAKKPADRFASSQEVAHLLDRCLSEMQHRGRVESLDDVVPLTTKPTNAVRKAVPSGTPVPSESAMPVPEKRPMHSRNRRWMTAAALFLTILVGLGITEATGITNVRGTVIRLFSPDGTLVVEVDDPGVSVSIDGEDMIISGAGAKIIRLKPGQYKVLGSKEGKLVSQELITVTKNGRQLVRVRQEADAAPTKTAPVALDRRPQFRTGGDWRIEKDELVQALPENARLFFGDGNWTDYDFEVEANSSGQTKDGHGIILMFRAKDLGNFLDLEVGGWSATVTEAVYFKEGKWGRSPGCFLKVPHEHGRWYKIKIEARGPRIKCSVDGKNLLAYSDETLLKGMIGVGTGNSPVRWRNLKVTAPDGRVLWKGFPNLD